jgi:hypothetical protein
MKKPVVVQCLYVYMNYVNNWNWKGTLWSYIILFDLTNNYISPRTIFAWRFEKLTVVIIVFVVILKAVYFILGCLYDVAAVENGLPTERVVNGPHERTHVLYIETVALARSQQLPIRIVRNVRCTQPDLISFLLYITKQFTNKLTRFIYITGKRDHSYLISSNFT